VVNSFPLLSKAIEGKPLKMCSAIRKPGWKKSTVLLHHWKFKCNKYCYRIGKKSGAINGQYYY